MIEPRPGDEAAAFAAVTTLLSRFPEGDGGPVAAMDAARDPGGQLMITVRPTNQDAATVDLKVTAEGKLELKVAHSRFDIVTDHSGPKPIELLAGILEAVFAGRVAEVPGRQGGTIKLDLFDGRTIKLGQVLAALGRPAWQGFAAYGDAPTLEPPPPGPSRLAQLKTRFTRRR